MGSYVIGVDGGASKTAAVVLDERRQVLGRGTSGPSNHHLVGLVNARAAVMAAMQEAANQAAIGVSQVSAVTWALAGAGRPPARRLFADLAREALPDISVRIENDAIAALVGGVGSRYGLVVIAGSGTIAYGENREGQQARAGGWGHLLDHGSAYDLAQGALRAVAQAHDGRGLPTQLTGRVLQALGLEDATHLIDWAYAPERGMAELVALAPLLLASAESGDLAATDVVMRGADALAGSVEAVARRLSWWGGPFPVVLAGGLLTSSEFYRQVVAQAIRERVPGAQPMLPRADAAVGAALLALETLGRALDAPLDLSDATARTWASEHSNVLSRDLDLRISLEVVGLMHLEDGRAVASLRPNLPAIANTVEALARRMRQGGRLIYVGAGTSGRLGALDAAECPPTFNTGPGQVLAIMAGGEKALVSSVEGAEDDRDAGRQAVIDAGVGSQDSVVGLAASGRTPYVEGALEQARQQGALTVAVMCNLPAPLARLADHVIAPLVGPEVLTGSTRLKAGTAQKLVLNMLSTGVMVRLGKTYGNLMVDMRQQSAKLQQRARRIVAQVCDMREEEAEAVLASSQGDVKVAIVSTLLACTPAEARERLAQAGGQVRAALATPFESPA